MKKQQQYDELLRTVIYQLYRHEIDKLPDFVEYKHTHRTPEHAIHIFYENTRFHNQVMEFMNALTLTLDKFDE